MYVRAVRFLSRWFRITDKKACVPDKKARLPGTDGVGSCRWFRIIGKKPRLPDTDIVGSFHRFRIVARNHAFLVQIFGVIVEGFGHLWAREGSRERDSHGLGAKLGREEEEGEEESAMKGGRKG
eukprot:2473153-Rhodomonas_salina.1